MSPIDRLARQIAEHSSAPLFGVPGSGATLTLIDELEKCGREFILTHFEGAAAMMAGTLGRLSGKAGVCLSIKGPGLANMVPGLAVSSFESFPLVAIAEAYGTEAPLSKAHKRIDQATLTSTVSKGLTQLTEEGPGFADLAGLAQAEIPGPVVLELARPQPDDPAPLPQANPEPSDLDNARIHKLVDAAQRPVVVAGALALRANLSGKLNALKIPVFTTAAAKGVADETLPHVAGVYTGVGLELSPEQHLLEEADLAMCIGVRPHEVLATRPFACPAINLSAVSEAGDDGFAFDATGTPGIAGTLLDLLATRSWGSSQVGDALARLRSAAHWDGFLPGHIFKLTQSHFGHAVRGVFDAGYFCTMAEHLWYAREASHCLMSGQGRYMGTGVPMGIAAAIHDKSVPTVAFLGDGGIGPFIGEARIAVERKLPLLFCLLSDGRFSSLRTRAIQDGLTQRPLTMAQPSWLPVMEGFGMPVFAANDEQTYENALQAWSPAGGPAFVEVRFDPDPYEAMVRGIR